MGLWKLAFGQRDRNVGYEFEVGRTIIFKYTRLVCKILADNDKLYYKYISIPSDARLQQIMKGFFDITKLPEMYGAIDGSHIKLAYKPKWAYAC